MDQLFLLQFPPMASSVHVVISSRFVCSRVMESYLYAGKKLKGGGWCLTGLCPEKFCQIRQLF